MILRESRMPVLTAEIPLASFVDTPKRQESRVRERERVRERAKERERES